jgi:RimJ/RimL family protein N-acetyltransferase
VLLVIEVAGEVAGGIQYHEERDPMYHHAGIDIYLGAHWQDRGLGSEAIRLLAQFLFEQRGHHRLVIDPAVANARAIAAYAKVGFRPVGVMRQYEQGADGHVRQGAQGLNTAGTGAAQWKRHSDHVSSTATKGKRSPSLDASSGSRPPLSKPAALSA